MEQMNVNREKCGFLVTNEQGTYAVKAVTQDILRVVFTKKEQIENQSLIVEPAIYEKGVEVAWEETKDEVRVDTKTVRAVFEKSTGLITFEDSFTGEVFTKEALKDLTKTDVVRYSTQGELPVVKRVKTVDGERSFIENLKPIKERVAYRGRLGFDWGVEESIHGLGQGEEGIYDYRGHCQYLYQHNMRIPMPFFVSDKGYGVLLDCCSLMTFQDAEHDSHIFLDTVEQLEYYFIGGKTMDGIIDGYRSLTGKAVMLPKWAYGYVQSKEAYQTDKELLEIGEEYRKREVPLDCIVQDWNTWKPGFWGEKKLDETRFGNMKEISHKLHEMNIHTMVSVWPNMAEGGDNHKEFVNAGYILGDYSTYDAFDEKARELYWQQASQGLFSAGFDSWWCDSTEPFSGPDWGGEVRREPWERYMLVGQEHKKYLDAGKTNAFALMHAKGIFENQRKEKPDKRVLNLTRSGYASQQKYGVVLWSGDISASWKVLSQQVAEGLNMAMSGMPYWTLDIGAFFVVGTAWQNRGCGNSDNPNPLWFWKGEYNEGVKDKGYCELYTRWFQFGTFLPMHRSHGTDTPREIWNFGEPGTIFYDAIEKFIKLRYTLMPYIYSIAGSVALKNDTMMRSLLFDFPQDKIAAKMGTEYMFGRNLLICPITKPFYYEAENTELAKEPVWDCYLPEGGGWYDFFDGTYYEGGQTIQRETTLTELPVFVKAGSIMPLCQENIQYASQKLEKPMVLEIYPGANGTFILYDDGGDDYEYEQGKYATISLNYQESGHTLTIGKREGSYPGMCDRRAFEVRIGQEKQVVSYAGEEIQIKL